MRDRLWCSCVGPTIVGIAVANAGLGIGGPDIDVVALDVTGITKSHSTTGRDPSLAAVSTAPTAQNVGICAKPSAPRAEPQISSATFDSVADAPAVAMGTRGQGSCCNECPRWDSNPHCLGFESSSSASWDTRAHVAASHHRGSPEVADSARDRHNGIHDRLNDWRCQAAPCSRRRG